MTGHKAAGRGGEVVAGTGFELRKWNFTFSIFPCIECPVVMGMEVVWFGSGNGTGNAEHNNENFNVAVYFIANKTVS